jgi:hypothetical protein
MTVNKETAHGTFIQTVIVGFPWNDDAPLVQDYQKHPSRVRQIRITFRSYWSEDGKAKPGWVPEILIQATRIKKNGEPYDELRNVTWYARTQIAALLSKLVAENMPTMLPQVEYSSDVSKLVSE